MAGKLCSLLDPFFSGDVISLSRAAGVSVPSLQTTPHRGQHGGGGEGDLAV